MGPPQDRRDDARRRPSGVHLDGRAGPAPPWAAAASGVPGRPQVLGGVTPQGVPRPADRTQPGLADRLQRVRTAGGGIWRICAVIDYATKYCLAAKITPTGRGVDALACLDAAVDEAERVLGLDDLRDDRGELELVDENTGEVIDVVPAPIAVVSDNGSCFRGETYQSAFAGDKPLLRHVRTRVRSPQTNGVIERFFGTLKYEHLYRAPIDDGGALAMETARFRDIYNRIRPHQALDDRTPRQAYLDT